MIPVNEKKRQFIDHIKANPRTILSSKFGDGKSYFIQELMRDEEIRKEFTFLKIYPVNYQVAENADIFELIKRDLLFQMMAEGMVSDRVTLTKSEELAWFLSSNGGNVIQEMLAFLPMLGMEAEMAKAVITTLKVAKVFTKLAKDFGEFRKKKEQGSEDYAVDQLLENLDASGVYECDAVTSIIKKSIEDYKRRTKKKIVLFIEDMDRIDPAHLFRILNILSAHMDYCYKFGVQPDGSLVGNKFGLDNIILVIEFNTLKRLFANFYGDDEGLFQGYISKFMSSREPFEYSLKEVKYGYIAETIKHIMGIDGHNYGWEDEMVKILFPPESLSENSLRETVQSFNFERYILRVPRVKTKEGKEIELDTTFLKILAIMKRLGVTADRITDRIVELLYWNYNDWFFRLIGPELFTLYYHPENDDSIWTQKPVLTFHIEDNDLLIGRKLQILDDNEIYTTDTYSQEGIEINIADLVFKAMKWIL